MKKHAKPYNPPTKSEMLEGLAKLMNPAPVAAKPAKPVKPEPVFKPVIVKDSNREKIAAWIDHAEGRATARTITYDTIIHAVEKIENDLGIPKAHMIGIKANCDMNAQSFPSAYKYTPESTQFGLEYTSSGWKVTWIRRDVCWNVSSKHIKLSLTDDAKAALIRLHENVW